MQLYYVKCISNFPWFSLFHIKNVVKFFLNFLFDIINVFIILQLHKIENFESVLNKILMNYLSHFLKCWFDTIKVQSICYFPMHLIYKVLILAMSFQRVLNFRLGPDFTTFKSQLNSTFNNDFDTFKTRGSSVRVGIVSCLQS